MSSNNPLADMMSKIMNAERVGKPECEFAPTSKKAQKLLEILKNQGYIEDFNIVQNQRGGLFNIKLSGKINKCGVVSPSFNVKNDGYEMYEKRFLPSKGFGLLIVTTTKGVMTHEEAKAKGLGGRLLGYCY